MAFSTQTAGNVAELDRQLNEQILAGDILGAFDAFYAEDVVMQENTSEPTAGKAANRAREQAFIDSVEEFHGVKLLGSAVNGDRSYSEWEIDATYKGGVRVAASQVAVRQWRGGQIVHERFYYNKG
jgi:ketosteroid isomerase-like protein